MESINLMDVVDKVKIRIKHNKITFIYFSLYTYNTIEQLQNFTGQFYK